ncbi:MAG: hypothetical protein A4E63_00251 [Syntrophorhabdus sp. PtaU1.Bin050]|nr:MAG: hypothetical protein A4E63_00251 [Syntrophorhabdus sp. PtaU1.Bin050]
MKHSPLPFKLEEYNKYSYRLVDADGEFINFFSKSRYGDNSKDPTAIANARLIVLACNHHQELKDALDKVIRYHEYVNKHCIWHLEANAQADLQAMLKELNALLSRIEEAEHA